MKSLILTLVSLFVALPALGQSWSYSIAEPTVDTTYDQSFSYTFSTAGDQTNRQDLTACDLASLEVSGADTAVSFFDCSDATTPRGGTGCRNVQNLPSAGSYGPVQVQFSRGWAHLWVTDAGGSGGTVTITCQGVKNKIFYTDAWYDWSYTSYSRSECAYIEVPFDSEELDSLWRAAVPLRLNSIWCQVRGGTYIYADLYVNDGTQHAVNGSDIQCTTAGVTDSSLGGTTAMDVADNIDVIFGTEAGGVDSVSICWFYTPNTQ